VNATTKDSQTNADVKSSYMTPTWVTTENMASTVIKDEFVKASDICVAETQSACTAAGIS
jgi:D-xylose transport system substrate-binding protein